MRKLLALIVIFSLALSFLRKPLPTAANTLHIRYFESTDTYLIQEQFRVLSISGLEGELLTIVAYGLEAGMVPSLTLLSPEGITLAEDLNSDANPVAFIQITVPMNGIYPFLVSRLSESGGLMRVMAFQGEPLAEDQTLLDTADPVLPARAFLLAGDSEEPVVANLKAMDEQAIMFASRGTGDMPPPERERQTPIQEFSWVNDDGSTFYTINVRALPDTPEANTLMPIPFDFQLSVNSGGDPQLLERPICQLDLIETVSIYNGPGSDYDQIGSYEAGATLELSGISEDSDWLQIADPNRLTGTSWIMNAGLYESALDPAKCVRVKAVDDPLPLKEVIENVLADEQPTSYFHANLLSGTPQASERTFRPGVIFLMQAYADDPDEFEEVYSEVQEEVTADADTAAEPEGEVMAAVPEEYLFLNAEEAAAFTMLFDDYDFEEDLVDDFFTEIGDEELVEEADDILEDLDYEYGDEELDPEPYRDDDREEAGEGDQNDIDDSGDEDGCIENCLPADSDGDGFSDDHDRCPYDAGSEDGCPPAPPPDSDGDGFLDDADGCPFEAGSEGGCPPAPPPDSDGDGFPDDADGCPFDPAPGSETGCP